MMKGLTRAGVGDVGSIEKFIEEASEYGFSSVDVSGSEIEELINSLGAAGAKKLLNDKHMEIGSLSLPVEWRADEETFRNQFSSLGVIAQQASALGCTACCTYVLPSTDDNAASFMAAATRRLRLCAQVLGIYGIRLGLEFVGPHHLRTQWKHPFIWDMASTLEWIDTIHEPNVGLLLDAYHWYTSESDVSEILQLNAAQVVHVHVNDAPPIPVAEVLDNNRLYPGEGVIPLVDFLQALQRIGYRGAVAQEVLTPKPPEYEAAVLLEKSREQMTHLFSRAGL
ncbi:sugar phosphate isomerase/epimerase [Alicyclobacillus sp. SO9]|uniref:sugar phosphate isomerase/epimerase family protein n=1 Tax=Alicyclobacillus sp. SO9 TaxID=2665646 RepID=UPI0018E7C799|nr:sugar phosphate isomerase/epimerase [Alicyclobacillus sp. SO9]QQE80524.1 sugar phosphate isomerase/epimerase [Alicyclobacillus sp. SO9]